MPRTRLYRHGVLEAEDFAVEEISEHLVDPDAVVWVDFCEPRPADLELVSEELGLHNLAIDDALQAGQRPKLDRYDSHLFAAVFEVRLDRGSAAALTTREIAAFITKQALVTVRECGFEIEPVIRRWDDSRDLAACGVPFLLWGLLDELVDGYFDVVQDLDAQLDTLEDLVFDERSRTAEVQRQSFAVRKSLVLLRRVVLPMREVVNSLLRRDLELLDPVMVPYYQDVYDHVLRAGEWTESLRDLVSTILETNVTVQGNRLNDIMKKVTSWAAIIAVPTAITGFYGQNIPYPGFASPAGFWMSTALMAGASGALYLTFKSRSWL